MSKKRTKLSDQVRQAVDDSELSRYRIALLTGIDGGTFSKFMAGKRGLSMVRLDVLADVLELELLRKKQSLTKLRKNRKGNT